MHHIQWSNSKLWGKFYSYLTPSCRAVSSSSRHYTRHCWNCLVKSRFLLCDSIDWRKQQTNSGVNQWAFARPSQNKRPAGLKSKIINFLPLNRLNIARNNSTTIHSNNNLKVLKKSQVLLSDLKYLGFENINTDEMQKNVRSW